MVSGISLGLNLVSLILLILPGIAGVKIGLLITDRADWLNRTDTIALSFGISLLSVVIFYLLYSNYKLGFASYRDLIELVSEPQSAIGVYMFIILISAVQGAILGYTEFGGDRVASRQGLWYKFFSIIETESSKKKYQVRVRMQNGDELQGRIEDKGEISTDRDILLENPRRLFYNQDGEIVHHYKFTGYAYLHNAQISHVEFDDIRDADRVMRWKFDDRPKDDDDDETEELEDMAKAQEEDVENNEGE
ncbi:DUF6338 family protein [Natrialbaceae archaeon AArc-T1-2]|uniref:DUF6338 family protein n=1 Tax=Natrialbaceae archaeon AArc-T1-2 TaxID=3053904 RepID=UPI00255A8E83|nr:DUF6338 family protein [Natrialbaceae archaeon AArc-T1-2]WIV67531.1 DUF6338 family protein [Natrialbaceae archaeon AArc-T1-2]